MLGQLLVVLEKAHTGRGRGNAPGPGGRHWDVLLIAVESQYDECDGVAKTTYGDIPQPPGATLVLTQEGQEISLSDGIQVLPQQRDDDGGHSKRGT